VNDANPSYTAIESRMLSAEERSELVDAVINADYLGDICDDVLEQSGGIIAAYIIGTTVLKFHYQRGFYAAEQFPDFFTAYEDAREFIG
jgi:hypothetical protein